MTLKGSRSCERCDVCYEIVTVGHMRKHNFGARCRSMRVDRSPCCRKPARYTHDNTSTLRCYGCGKSVEKPDPIAWPRKLPRPGRPPKDNPHDSAGKKCELCLTWKGYDKFPRRKLKRVRTGDLAQVCLDCIRPEVPV